jgi:hypothetical protein
MTMLQGLVVTLVVTAPTLVIEENWHGRPMIDQPGHLWLLPTLVVAAGFALGGAVCARRTTELWRALFLGIIVGTVAAGALVVADVIRRAMHHQVLKAGVPRLWIEAALLSIVLASLGGAMGYLHSTRRR